jgi:NAD(P)-dependent dehydrogenase (short-subunit alcohol dehydrogenase family)
VTSTDLSGQVVVVTGGAGGIGAACVAAFRASGANVAILDREIPPADGYAVVADVTSTSSLNAAVTSVERDLGPIDVLVHAAGVSGPWQGVLDLDEADWDVVMSVNAGGTYRTCRAILPGMVARGYGRVVLLASVAGKEGVPLLPAYSASKAAVIAFAKSVGKDLASSGVLINCVTPAGVDAGMTRENTAEIQQRMRAAIPMGRFATPEEIAAMVVWLSSPTCSFSTGAVFDLSGGRSSY